MYKAILFALNGDWVTDFRECKTIEEVEECLADMGSKWYFYPLCAVITDRGLFTTSTQRIVSAVYPLDWWRGRTIRTTSRDIVNHSAEYEALLNA
jgi:hypothetical protein